MSSHCSGKTIISRATRALGLWEATLLVPRRGLFFSVVVCLNDGYVKNFRFTDPADAGREASNIRVYKALGFSSSNFHHVQSQPYGKTALLSLGVSSSFKGTIRVQEPEVIVLQLIQTQKNHGKILNLVSLFKHLFQCKTRGVFWNAITELLVLNPEYSFKHTDGREENLPEVGRNTWFWPIDVQHVSGPTDDDRSIVIKCKMSREVAEIFKK